MAQTADMQGFECYDTDVLHSVATFELDMNKFSQELEQRVIDLYRQGEKVKAIAQALGVDLSSIYNVLKRNNVKTSRSSANSGKRLSSEQKTLILSDYQSGLKTVQTIAAELGVDNSTVYNLLKSAGVKPTRNDERTLPLSVQETIVRLYQEGVEIKTISAGLEIDKTSVFNVLKRNGISLDRFERKTWRKYQILNEDYFEEIDTEEKAYFLGFLMADGYVQGERRIAITLQAGDVEILEALKAAIGSNSPIRNKISKLNGKEFASVHFSMCSIKIAQDLQKWGIVERKSWEAQYPDLPDEPRIHAGFIRGLLDGDGCVTGQSRGCGAVFRITGTMPLIQGVESSLKRYTQIKKLKAVSPCRKGGLISYAAAHDIHSIQSFLWTPGCLHLTRKLQKLQLLLAGHPVKEG